MAIWMHIYRAKVDVTTERRIKVEYFSLAHLAIKQYALETIYKLKFMKSKVPNSREIFEGFNFRR